MKTQLIFLFSLLIFASCAVNDRQSILEGVPEESEVPKSAAEETVATISERGNLVIIREHAEPMMFDVSVLIDGKKAVSLKQKQYAVLNIAPGQHFLKSRWPMLSGQKGYELSIEIVDGETYYVAIHGLSRLGIMETGFVILPPVGVEEALSFCCELKQ